MASLIVGQTINVRGPKGAFVYEPNMVRHFGMVAGGTGITPMLQIIRAILRARPVDRTEVDLIFANVTSEDILLKDDLDAMAREDRGFRVHYVLDKPPKGWKGGVGFVTSDMITVREVLPSPCSTTSFYSKMKHMLTILFSTEMATETRRRRQDSPMRPSANDQQRQEDSGGFRL